jgi:aryl-alcohol dehydrogenase-like predicted oxidoreductase
MGDGPNRGPGLSAYKIKREIDESLRRLQTDHLDLYQMHQVDRSGIGWDELWGAFEDLVRAGKTIYVGSSNFAGWEIAHAQGHATRRNFLGLVTEQHKYNLATREPEFEVLPCCKALGIAVIPHSPLANGFLSGKALHTDEAVRSKSPKVQYQVERRREQLTAYSALCRRVGLTEPAVALAWLLHNPAITSPIIGSRTVEQLESSVKAMAIKLDDSTMEELATIFPGPGKPAPQAYLWPAAPPKD